MPRSRSRRPVLLCVLAIAAVTPLPRPLQAQQLRPGLLVGRLVAPDGEPIADAVLRATKGSKTIIAYSEGDGDYRLGGLGTGAWTVSIRRLGFVARILDVDLPAAGLRRDLTLERRTPTRDSALVAANWIGVRGVVGDARRETPLAGAVVVLLGADSNTHSDSLGEFALPLPRARAIALRVERAGYLTRLVTATIPEGSYLHLDISLDTATAAPRDAWLWRDLEARLKYATPRAAQVDFAELQKIGATSLWVALESAPTIIRKSILITRRACIFVDGIPRPGVPVDALVATDLELVEVYPPGSELTRTLARAWPLHGECGVQGSTAMRFGNERQTAQFISVWQHTP